MLFSIPTNLDVTNLDVTSAIADPEVRSTTTLVLGDSGADVVELQKLLLHWSAFSGYTSDIGTTLVNGHFDGAVRAAVEQFQASMFLQADGVVGALTWQALYAGSPVNMPTLRPKSIGIEVVRLQRILIKTSDLPLNSPVNGEFDHNTEQAVRRFQERLGLTVDGVVEMQTWYALSKTLVGL